MLKKSFAVAVVIIMILAYAAYNNSIQSHRTMKYQLFPSLPRPIAREAVLITSAGQGTDAYILNDIANELMIHNYFMPQAKAADLEGINTVVFVIDYSPLGEKINQTSFMEDKQRITQLIEKSLQEKLTIITVFNGKRPNRGEQNEELLQLLTPASDYLICTEEADRDGLLSDLASASKIPITLVNDVSDISEPFASAFR